MSIFFCLDDLLETLTFGDAANDKALRFKAFVPVRNHPPECGGHFTDALTLASQPKVLDLNNHDGIYKLATLVEEVPLYQINLELLLDEALTERHHNKMIYKALYGAFEGQPLPNTIQDQTKGDILEGTLRHPMLGHLDKVTLCSIYANFIRALPDGHDGYAFEKYILGRHPEPFQSRFDGYLFGTGGKIRADLLLGFGIRNDFDPRRPLEDYMENGRARVARMRITEKREILWAWLEADSYQMRRCHDIDRILSLQGLPRMPNWMRTDVFNCLEKEAMKQVLGAQLLESDSGLSMLAKQPGIRKAIQDSAEGRVDENLQQLLTQTLNTAHGYAGAGKRFCADAAIRARESKSL